VAAAFMESGGDLKAILRVLFATEAFHGTRGNLLKRPWRFVVSALRAADCDVKRSEPIVEFLRRMGHAPFQYPSPDGYPIEPDPWLGTLLWRWNFALDLARGQLGGAGFNPDRLRRVLGDEGALAAHVLGRAPTELETEALRACNQPLALVLASPAFQRHQEGAMR
jgi:uncharacterized protein (DUF1800 family)